MAAEPKTLVVGRPNVLDPEGFLEDVAKMLKTGLLTNGGPFVLELEAGVAAYLGGGVQVVAVSNATVGLELALRALELPAGAEVLVPSFTFCATAHAVRLAGLEPVFVDVDEGSHFASVRALEAARTPRTAAVVPVHLWGRAAPAADDLEAWASRAEVAVVYDAAHAFGAAYADGAKVGTRGRAEVFSMHATKLLNTFEGGLVVTRDAALRRAVASARNFGFDGQDTIARLGGNGKLSEVHAALAFRHLRVPSRRRRRDAPDDDERRERERERCSGHLRAEMRPPRTAIITKATLRTQVVDDTIAHYRATARRYAAGLAARGLAGAPDAPLGYWNASFLDEPGPTQSYVIVRVKGAFGATRDEVMTALRARGVMAKRYFYPGVHAHAPYAAARRGPLPATDALNREVLVLPTGTAVGPGDVDRVCDALRAVHDARVPVRAALAPADFDRSAFETTLRAIDDERDALRARLRELDATEATVRRSLDDEVGKLADAPAMRGP